MYLSWLPRNFILGKLCGLQYAEFIAALQPQIADDTSAVARHSAAPVGNPQHAQANEAPAQLLMQPQPGASPHALQSTMGYRNTVIVPENLDSGHSFPNDHKISTDDAVLQAEAADVVVTK